VFTKISEKIPFPGWVRKCPRFKRLDILDRLLDGTFYDHLPFAFYDEKDPNHKEGGINPLVERRPSAQFRLPRMVARQTARKLFSGRHIPRLRHKDKKAAKRLEAILVKMKFWSTMREAALFGSVGSVAVTFVIDQGGAAALTVWRGKFCWPSFDASGELQSLRVCYPADGHELKARGMTVEKPGKQHWYIRDFTPQADVTYQPPIVDDWNPVEGFADPDRQLVEHLSVPNPLAFVPGVWLRNLESGTFPDGTCTFEDAIPDSIELDYTFSQVGRGIRYNAAPQLMVRGEILNADEDGADRGPVTVLQVQVAKKSDGGDDQEGAGDAKLLEMTGSGVEASLKYVEALRKYALEQIEAFRKDPEHMTRVVSGRAMEFLDEESNDLVADLRSCYGEYGGLRLIKKMVTALRVLGHAKAGVESMALDGLSLLWPRQFQPTPQDLQSMIPALCQALDPLEIGANLVKAGTGGGGEGGGTPAPSLEALLKIIDDNRLIEVDDIRAYLAVNMDLGILDGPDEGAADDSDDDDGPDDDKPPPQAEEQEGDGGNELTEVGEAFLPPPAPER